MGWFNQKDKDGKKEDKIPELPKLPELPETKLEDFSPRIHQLPSFPNNSLGEKFSQNTIKEAVSGKKEGEEDSFANEFAGELDSMQKMQRPLKKPRIKENRGDIYETRKIKKEEPFFVRIDKFEEGLRTFEKAKEKVIEIENVLKDIQTVKEKEKKTLDEWENEIIKIKEQIERVDRDIFSKIE